MRTGADSSSGWPELDFSQIKDTLETLHQWIQIVGKIRLNTMPWQNHSWHSTLYASPRGYSTQSIPYRGRVFQIEFDFRKHQLIVQCSDTSAVRMALRSRTVADFYDELFEPIHIDTMRFGFSNGNVEYRFSPEF